MRVEKMGSLIHASPRNTKTFCASSYEIFGQFLRINTAWGRRVWYGCCGRSLRPGVCSGHKLVCLFHCPFSPILKSRDSSSKRFWALINAKISDESHPVFHRASRNQRLDRMMRIYLQTALKVSRCDSIGADCRIPSSGPRSQMAAACE